MKTTLFDFFQRRQFKDILGPLIAFSCVAYFIYHSIQGDHGLLSLLRMRQKLEVVKSELNLLQAQKEVLDRRVYLLRPDSLDLDMLEERARAVLNFGRSDEVIIFEDAAPVSPPAPSSNTATSSLSKTKH